MYRFITSTSIIITMVVLLLSCQDKGTDVTALEPPATATLAADISLDQSAIIEEILRMWI